MSRRKCSSNGFHGISCSSGVHVNGPTLADPVEAEKPAKAIVKAATHYQDPKVLLEVSEDLQGAMKGLAVSGLDAG